MSAPITTGSNYLRVLRSHASRGTNPSSLELQQVTEANIQEARRRALLLRQRFAPWPVIDPTAMEAQEGWEQHHYHDLWLAVIEEFSSLVVVPSDWALSIGCVLELVRAFELGIRVESDLGEPLGLYDCTELLASSLRAYSELGPPPQLLELSLDRILEIQVHEPDRRRR